MVFKNLISFSLFFFIYLFYWINIFPQTTVSDTVSGVWTKENSPYNVISDIIIPANKTLEINEGVEIRFNGFYKLVVNGLLIAKGTGTDSIKFIPDTSDRFWNGIKFINADSLCSLEYCLIEKSLSEGDSLRGAGGAIYCEGTVLNISFSTIRDNESKTKYLMLNGSAVCGIYSGILMENNIIKHNTGYGGAGGGIYAFNSSLTLNNNAFINNTSANTDSIYVSEGGTVYFENSSIRIKNNLICRNNGNSSSAVYTYQCFDSEFINNTIVFNNAKKYPSALLLNGKIQNNIIFFNRFNLYSNNQVAFSNADVEYNDIENSFGQYSSSNFSLNPLFINENSDDFHLSGYSPCIDAGNPESEYINEPEYNGKRINLGCYGNTIEAANSAPLLNISSQVLGLDTVHLGQNLTRNLLIKNTGKSRLNIKFNITSDVFSIDTLNEFSILGNDSLSIPINYSPVRTAADTCRLHVLSNNESEPDSLIILSGTGILGGEYFGTLYKKYSPYNVSENLTISKNKNLIIEPGTTLKLDSLVSIKAYGNIIADGTPGDFIIFEPASSNPVPGSWEMINIDHNDSSSFEFCKFYYPKRGLNIYVSKTEIADCYFYDCQFDCIHCDLSWGKGNEFRRNKFLNSKTGIYVDMSDCLIENSLFQNLNLGLYVYGSADIKNNKMSDVNSGVFGSSASITMTGNEIVGMNPTFNFRSDYVFLQYISGQSLQSFNVKLGIVAPPNEISDVYLLNDKELGDPDRECIQIIQKPPAEVIDIPQSGYKTSVSVNNIYGTFIIKTKDGGHAKLSKYLDVSGSIIGYGFRYIYVPAGVSNFPVDNDSLFSNGVYVLSGSARMIDNKISNFYNSGASFNCTVVDTFMNNIITGNHRTGIFFYGTENYKNNNRFVGGSNEDEFNEVYNNNNYNFIYCNQENLNLPYFYWGSDSESTVSNLIFDNRQLSTLGMVRIQPYLNSMHDTVAVGIDDQKNGLPSEYLISQNFPNPFNPATIINYQVPVSCLVTIRVYDVLGREIQSLVNDIKNPGSYKVKFNGSHLSSGFYFYRIEANNFRETKKMLLMK